MLYFADVSDRLNNDYFWAYMDMREAMYLCPINARDLLMVFCGSPM